MLVATVFEFLKADDALRNDRGKPQIGGVAIAGPATGSAASMTMHEAHR